MSPGDVRHSPAGEQEDLPRPLASIIMPTFNREQLLGWTLEALCRQTTGTAPFEVILIDDGSTDGTAQVVARYSDRIRLVYLYQEDEGFRVARARNLGLERARAQTIVFLDAGVLPGRHWLAAHLSCQARAPAVVIGYLWGYMRDDIRNRELAELIDPLEVDTSIERLADDGSWLDLREDGYQQHGDELRDLPAPWLYLWTGNASAPAKAIRAVGGFDEFYQSWGVEDLDLGIALHRANVPYALERNAASIHYPHPRSSGTPVKNVNHLMEKYPCRAVELLSKHRGVHINHILMQT